MSKSGGHRVVSVNCPNCGAPIVIKDELASTVQCPYCGSTFRVSALLGESEEIDREKILARERMNAEREKTERERLRYKRERQEKKEAEGRLKRFRQNISKFIGILLMILMVLMGVSSLTMQAYRSMVLAFIIASMFLAYLFTDPQRKKNRRKLLFWGAVMLIFPYFYLLGLDATSPLHMPATEYSWDEIVLHDKLPEPPDHKAEISANSSQYLQMYIVSSTKQEYEDYVTSCKEAGYTVDIDRYDSSFYAYNSDGYKLALYFQNSGKISLSLTAPKEMSEISWSDISYAKLLPAPKSTRGDIENDSSTGLSVVIADTPIQDYNEYVRTCSEAGFNVDYSRNEKSYHAKNADGYQLYLRYEGYNMMYIYLYPKK